MAHSKDVLFLLCLLCFSVSDFCLFGCYRESEEEGMVLFLCRVVGYSVKIEILVMTVVVEYAHYVISFGF